MGNDLFKSSNDSSEVMEQIRHATDTGKLKLRRLLSGYNGGIPEDIQSAITASSSSLTELDLSSNALVVLTSNFFDSMTNLKTVTLDANKFTSLPPKFFQLTGLTSLSLSHNLFGQQEGSGSQGIEFFANFSGLENVTTLNLSKCKISNITSHISCLVNLKELNLSENEITKIEQNSIAKLKKLTQLDLSKNKLKIVPSDFVLLENVGYIDISHNSIEEFPKIFPELEKTIQFCKANNNQIRFVPYFVCHSTLRMLDLRFNPNLTKIPFAQRHSNSEAFFSDIPDLVFDGLYLGNVSSSQNINVLKEYNIKYIVRILVDTPGEFPQEINYKIIPLWDSNASDIAAHFEDTVKFIDNAFGGIFFPRKFNAASEPSEEIAKRVSENPQQDSETDVKNVKPNVLVHCEHGRSRSASVVLAYLMYLKKWSLTASLEYLRKRRPIVKPNPDFMKQLTLWQSKLGIVDENGK